MQLRTHKFTVKRPNKSSVTVNLPQLGEKKLINYVSFLTLPYLTLPYLTWQVRILTHTNLTFILQSILHDKSKCADLGKNLIADTPFV